MRTTIGWRAAGATLLLALGGGAAPPPLIAQPLPTAGTISIGPGTAAAELTSTLPIFADAIGETFTARGFTRLEGSGHAALVADFTLQRTPLGTTTAKVPASRSRAGPGGAMGVGASAVFALPTGKSTVVPLQRTRLEIRIHKRDDQTTLWQGAATTVRPAGTREGKDEAVASALSGALLSGYPSRSAEAVSVP